VQSLSYAFQLGGELGQKAVDCIQPRAKLSDVLRFHSAPSIPRSQSFLLSPMPNSTHRNGRDYVSIATERGASGLVAEKAGQSIWYLTLRVRLRAFVADQKFGDGARDVVHPTDLERGDREALRWSDASPRDENSHAGGEEQSAGQHPHVYLPTMPLAIDGDSDNEAIGSTRPGRPNRLVENANFVQRVGNSRPLATGGQFT
jgi:hypothetical protein